MNHNEVIGSNIRFERKKRGLTIDELSDIVDIAPGFLGLIERGQRGTSIKNLCSFSNYFGISLDNLITIPSNSNIKVAENSALKQKRDTLITYANSMGESELNFAIEFVKGFKKYENKLKGRETECNYDEDIE